MTEERRARILARRGILTAEQFTLELAEQGYHADFILLPQADHGATIPLAIRQAMTRLQEN